VEMRLPLGCWQFGRARDWRSSATMPRWAVRPGFVRPITGVAVKRVQAMTPTDVIAAAVQGMIGGKYGCRQCNNAGWTFSHPDKCPGCNGTGEDPVGYFRVAWDARYVNTSYTWPKNPLAWGITIVGKQ